MTEGTSQPTPSELQYLAAIDRRNQRIAALEAQTWALARTMIGEAVLPCGRAVPAETMLAYLRQRTEAPTADAVQQGTAADRLAALEWAILARQREIGGGAAVPFDMLDTDLIWLALSALAKEVRNAK